MLRDNVAQQKIVSVPLVTTGCNKCWKDGVYLKSCLKYPILVHLCNTKSVTLTNRSKGPTTSYAMAATSDKFAHTEKLKKKGNTSLLSLSLYEIRDLTNKHLEIHKWKPSFLPIIYRYKYAQLKQQLKKKPHPISSSRRRTIWRQRWKIESCREVGL